MITKVFFTMLVIVIVGMVFKSQNQNKAAQSRHKEQARSEQQPSSLAPRTVAYLLIGLLIIVSGTLAYFSWSDANQVVTIRVFNSSGAMNEYQVYRKNIKDREFTSIEGIYIRLADSDRLEMLVNQ